MASQQKAMGRVEAKKEGVTQAASRFQLRRRDRPSRRRPKQSLSRAREVSDVLSLFHLYALRVGDDAQRANGKKSDSKPEERISKRHSLPPGVRRRYIANYRDGSRRAQECVFKSAGDEKLFNCNRCLVR